MVQLLLSYKLKSQQNDVSWYYCVFDIFITYDGKFWRFLTISQKMLIMRVNNVKITMVFLKIG